MKYQAQDIQNNEINQSSVNARARFKISMKVFIPLCVAPMVLIMCLIAVKFYTNAAVLESKHRLYQLQMSGQVGQVNQAGQINQINWVGPVGAEWK